MRLTDAQIIVLAATYLKWANAGPDAKLDATVAMRGTHNEAWKAGVAADGLVKYVGEFLAGEAMDWVLSPKALRIIRYWEEDGFHAASMRLAVDGDSTTLNLLRNSALEYSDKHPRPEAISRYKLYDMLGFKSETIPKETAVTMLQLPLPGRDNSTIGPFNLTILPHTSERKNSSKHRIFVQCRCRRQVPFGRMHQHQCPYSYEFADKFPFKVYNTLNGVTTYHKSLETATVAATNASQIFEWSRKADKWVETKPQEH